MLNFIVPLKSPQASNDWKQVSRLCRRTLRSLYRQTSDQFRVFLVCNQPPEGMSMHPNLRIVHGDFPIPAADKQSQIADKARKVRRGLMAVREVGGGFVMGVDADDLVHRALAALVSRHPQSNGWFIPLGYSHDEGSHWLERHADFHLRCGTSNIIRLASAELPEDLDSLRERFFILCHGHHAIAKYLAGTGRPLERLPFPGAIYVKETGENNSGPNLRHLGVRATLSKLMRTRPLTPVVRAAFGLVPLD
ncbi:MAG TPA: hypothetical protein VGD78_16555 [Chthoniobacterales bacterium]